VEHHREAQYVEGYNQVFMARPIKTRKKPGSSKPPDIYQHKYRQDKQNPEREDFRQETYAPQERLYQIRHQQQEDKRRPEYGYSQFRPILLPGDEESGALTGLS
jgi:hypothetical protein